MNKITTGLFAAAALMIVGLTAPAPAEAQGPENKVVICHTPSHRADTIKGGSPCSGPETKDGDPKAIEIEISVNACPAHLGRSCDVQ